MTAGIWPAPSASKASGRHAPSREDRRDAMRIRTALTQLPHPIAVAPTPNEAKTRAAKIADALLQQPAVRRQFAAAGIPLPPIHRQAASTAPFTLPTALPRPASPSAPVRSSFTPKEALAALNDMREDIRRERGHPTLMQAFALACERRPDLAEAAGIGGAGMATVGAWLAGTGRTHATGCECGGDGICAGWQPASAS